MTEHPTRYAGSAPRRTDFAWSRTGLALAAIIIVVLRRLPHDTKAPVILCLLGAGLAAWSIAFWVLRRSTPDHTSPWPTLGERSLRLVTLGVVLLAGAAFTVALFPAP